jgi:hypothetical protein
MTQPRALYSSLLAWVAVWAVWRWATPGFHANWTLATIATTAMVGAFAAISYFNLLVLVPRWWCSRPAVYWENLFTAIIVMTGVALAIIRFFYKVVFGPYLVKPWYVDFGIDLVLMMVHVAAAAVVAWLYRRLS